MGLGFFQPITRTPLPVPSTTPETFWEPFGIGPGTLSGDSALLVGPPIGSRAWSELRFPPPGTGISVIDNDLEDETSTRTTRRTDAGRAPRKAAILCLQGLFMYFDLRRRRMTEPESVFFQEIRIARCTMHGTLATFLPIGTPAPWAGPDKRLPPEVFPSDVASA